MTATEVRTKFDAAIANTTDAEQIAKLELAREYFTNPEFRAKMEQAAWDNRR